MQLTVSRHKVTEVLPSEHSAFDSGVLRIDTDVLADRVNSSAFADLRVEIARPQESCRVTQVLDVACPYAKVDGSPDYPGILSPIEPAGHGRAVALDNCNVVVVTDVALRSSELIDMSGPGAELGEFGSDWNICLVTIRAAGVSENDYLRACKLAMLNAAVFIARLAADARPDILDVHASAPASDLPRVAYIMMLHSHQVPTQPGEPILYGGNTRGLHPVLLHPNETIDGGLVASYWAFGVETYHIQRRSMVHALLNRHGRALDFAGVVGTVALPSSEDRERVTMMAASTVKNHLRADGAILTKVGGGIPQTDLMLTIDLLEGYGVSTVAASVEAIAGARPGETLTVFAEEADALISLGGHDGTVELPPVERVIGPVDWYERANRVNTSKSDADDASGELVVRISDLAGATSQFGATNLKGVNI